MFVVSFLLYLGFAAIFALFLYYGNSKTIFPRLSGQRPRDFQALLSESKRKRKNKRIYFTLAAVFYLLVTLSSLAFILYAEIKGQRSQTRDLVMSGLIVFPTFLSAIRLTIDFNE